MTVRLWVAFASAVAVSASAPRVRAEPVEKALERAVAAMAKGDLKTACPDFRRIYTETQDVRALVNVADCDEREGLLVEALGHWREAEPRLASSYPALRDRAVERIRALDDCVPTLTLAAPDGFPAGAVVELDGKTAVRGSPIRVNPGEHTVTVDVTGRPRWTKSLVLKEKDRTAVALGSADGAGPADKPKTDPTLWIAGGVVGGVGVIGVVAFAVTGGLVLEKKSQFELTCPNHLCLPGSEGARIGEEGKTLNIVNGVSLGVGLAALGTGIALIAVAATQKPKVASARVRPFGLGVAGSF